MVYAVVTCERKLFQNYFSLHQSLPEIILFQHVKTCRKLYQIISQAYCSLRIFSNMFIVAEIF